MMKTVKLLAFIFSFLFTTNFTYSQNCGYVDDFRKTVVDNGNGTSTYNFEIDVKTTSGGGKSVKFKIDCNSYLFESNECLKTGTSTITYSYGPYTLAHSVCNISPSIIWTGHTNDKCGGATCIGETITLPVTMLDFTAKKLDNKVVLDWATASEINNSGFEVHHSIDGVLWTKIGWVNGNGTSNEINKYQFVHDSASNGNNFYQLKQVDFDGQFEFTQITKVLNSEKFELNTISAYPNPFKNEITINGTFEEIKLYSLTGLAVNVKVKGNKIDTKDLSAGVYYLIAKTYKGVETLKITKQ